MAGPRSQWWSPDFNSICLTPSSSSNSSCSCLLFFFFKMWGMNKKSHWLDSSASSLINYVPLPLLEPQFLHLENGKIQLNDLWICSEPLLIKEGFLTRYLGQKQACSSCALTLPLFKSFHVTGFTFQITLKGRQLQKEFLPLHTLFCPWKKT